MNEPKIRIGEIIKIGINPTQVVRLYTNDERKSGRAICGDAEVVYYQDKLKGIKVDIIWNNDKWDFISNAPHGTYVDIRNYPELLKK